MTEPAPQGPATSPTDAATSATQDPAPATNPGPAAQESAFADIAAASKALAWLRENHADYGLNVEISGPRGDRRAVLYDARRDLEQASESGRIMLECHETGGAKVRGTAGSGGGSKPTDGNVRRAPRTDHTTAGRSSSPTAGTHPHDVDRGVRL